MNFILIALWVIATFIIIDFSFMFVSLPDTMLNIIGALILCVWGVFSYYTRCLTKILTLIKRKNDEKKN